MARFLVYFLIMANAHLLTALAGNSDERTVAEPPFAAARKFGKHGEVAASSRSPTESEERSEFSREVSANGAAAEQPVMETNHRHHHHHAVDKSVAGGGVILGGLATTFLVVVFCYIRATGRKNAEPGSPSSTTSFIGTRDTEPVSPTNSSN